MFFSCIISCVYHLKSSSTCVIWWITGRKCSISSFKYNPQQAMHVQFSVKCVLPVVVNVQVSVNNAADIGKISLTASLTTIIFVVLSGSHHPHLRTSLYRVGTNDRFCIIDNIKLQAYSKVWAVCGHLDLPPRVTSDYPFIAI